MKYQGLKTLKEQVRHILEQSVDARNNDVRLVEQVCAAFAHDPLRNTSNIERYRRFWQSKGMFLPTSEAVARERRMNIDEWRITMGYPTKDTGGTEKPSYTPPSEVPNPKASVVFMNESKQSTLFKGESNKPK